MKGVQYLARAFSSLVDARPPSDGTTLTVVGGGVPAAAILSAFSETARPHVTVVDRVSEEEVIAAYRSHDVMAFPSSYEGFGMVLLEAMSQRLPVVATPVGCATMLVRDGDTGLIVPPRNSDALAAALNRMLDDPTLRSSVAERAFQRVREMSWTRTARETLKVYGRALNGFAR